MRRVVVWNVIRAKNCLYYINNESCNVAKLSWIQHSKGCCGCVHCAQGPCKCSSAIELFGECRNDTSKIDLNHGTDPEPFQNSIYDSKQMTGNCPTRWKNGNGVWNYLLLKLIMMTSLIAAVIIMPTAGRCDTCKLPAGILKKVCHLNRFY